MDLTLIRDLATLHRLTVPELRAKYAALFGEPTRANNRPWLLKRLAWRLQALAEGDLSERAKRRAAELANDADLRLYPPHDAPTPAAPAETKAQVLRFAADDRLPPPGTVLTRLYKGRTLQVEVRADGFRFEGHRYASLSAVAKAITGSHCNGYLFFRIGQKGDDR